jgi:hypothetical protein
VKGGRRLIHSLFRILLVFFLTGSGSAKGFAQDFGYLAGDDETAAVWWAEGAYKIKKDDPLPEKSRLEASLRAARNEYEPFELVLRPKKRMDKVRVEASSLRESSGAEIPRENVSICHVEYVKVVQPTDSYGAPGDWPDPLPPYDGPFTAYADENHPLWITVHVPKNARPGLYRGTVTLSCGDWKKEIPVALTVRPFTLPDEPSIRSSFGIPIEQIRAYHNLETREEMEKVFDLYMQNCRDHRVCPRSPFDLYPMKVRFSGIGWEGGEFVGAPVHGGRRALKIEDNAADAAREARAAERIPVKPGTAYSLKWFVRTEKEGQEYTVLVQGYDAEGRLLPAQNRLIAGKGTAGWKGDSLSIEEFSPEVRTVSVHLLPTFRDAAGTRRGTAYFDDISFEERGSGRNLLPNGDFEADVGMISVRVDWDEFDRAGRRYLDDFGFNSFDLPVEGLGSGSFYSSEKGMFGGFRQGTPEYDRLLSAYLAQVQDHLEKNGWLGKEYVYWFDEPDPKDYPFVREGMINIRKNASKLTRFITEHNPGPDIMDVSEIGCTIFDKVDPKAVAELSPKGREFWSYLCTGPKGPWVSLFIDHPAVNLRVWLWLSYKFGLEGILVWRANYWTSSTVFPLGTLQNPWEDPMSYTVGYGLPYGQVNYWGNGDGRFLYPPNRSPSRDKAKHISGPVNSIRWEILREGIEDFEYFKLLEAALKKANPGMKKAVEEARRLLEFPEEILVSGREYSKDPRRILEHRDKIAEAIVALGPSN